MSSAGTQNQVPDRCLCQAGLARAQTKEALITSILAHRGASGEGLQWIRLQLCFNADLGSRFSEGQEVVEARK